MGSSPRSSKRDAKVRQASKNPGQRQNPSGLPPRLTHERIQAAPHEPAIEDETLLNGSIRVILTWNLCESAFLASDGSKARYPLLRGSGKFAEFVRDLGERFVKSNYFVLDGDNTTELSESYKAGLLSQYAAEYEFNATFRVNDNLKACDFFLKRQGTEPAVPDPFTKAWDAWPIKRFRISRYGTLQVILETEMKTEPERFVSRTEFLEPINLLHNIIKDDNNEAGHNWVGRPTLTVTAQWEIVGNLLSRIIEVIERYGTEDDLVRFDPAYRFAWRERDNFAAGTSLPLRTEYTVLWIRKVKLAGASIEPKDLTQEKRRAIASLLEEVPWIEGPSWAISPQRQETIRRLLRQDEATWSGELCLLSFGTAVLTTLHPLDMSLPREMNYESYWKVVRRVIEYFAELRLLARLVERQSADLFEYMLRDLATMGRLHSYEERVRSRAALSGLANRLRVAASADTIPQSDAILPKAERLRAIFDIGRSLEHADRNLSAVQDLITSAESQHNERGVLILTAGLAGFTAILMGLALPTYFVHSSDLESEINSANHLGRILIGYLISGWAIFSVLLTLLALLTATIYVTKFFRLGPYLQRFAKKVERAFSI